MRRIFLAGLPIAATLVSAQAPTKAYNDWTGLLQAHYDPLQGMDYDGLARSDWQVVERLSGELANVDPSSLDAKDRLAYYLNLYNITVVRLMMENRQVHSIRDLSTDPFIRINIFKKPLVQMRGGPVSLQFLENHLIREGYHDPRIHFALNCAARSCPPLRREAYDGRRLEAQLDDQTRAFFASPAVGARFETAEGRLIIHLTKIMDGGSWFGSDFEIWGGGKLAFLHRFVSPDRQRLLDQYEGRIRLVFDDYDWSLNRWVRP